MNKQFANSSVTEANDEVFYFTIPGWESFDSRQALDWRKLKIEN